METAVSLRRLGACLLLGAGLAATACAQEVAALRLNFERSWIVATLGPVKRQMSELVTLEKKLAASRDYDGAIRAREERLKLQHEIERLDKELLLLQSREVSMKAAELGDKITLSIDNAVLKEVKREGGALTGWSRPGASAEWKLPSLPPGGYEVVLRYRCGPLEGGSITAKESRFTLTGPVETTLKGPEDRNLGTLKLSEGATTLTLTATTVFKDNLMQLLGVTLVPASR
ncbi:MAG: hypothetical protein RIS79_1065 [Verrucomicrobiota bacterium]|jgi:hypothetical protein